MYAMMLNHLPPNYNYIFYGMVFKNLKNPYSITIKKYLTFLDLDPDPDPHIMSSTVYPRSNESRGMQIKIR